MTFQFFSDENFDLERAMRRFNPNPEKHLDQRLGKRMTRYLANLAEKLNPRISIDKNMDQLQQHIRKLPKKYHNAARDIATAYVRGLWKI